MSPLQIKMKHINAANCFSNSSNVEYIQNAMKYSDRLSHSKTHKHLKSLKSSLLFGKNVNVWVMEVAGKYESLSVDYFLLSFEEWVLPIFTWLSAICDQVSEAALFMRKDRTVRDSH